jgi:ADP-ribosylglycohydrolase
MKKNLKTAKRILLKNSEYSDKVYGCWLGKNIGGTLGAPYECSKYFNSLTFYEPVPDKPLPNDDLDLQLVWLKMIEDKGAKNITFRDFADYWLKYLEMYPWDEYGHCIRNLKDGLVPPVSGCFENSCISNMGSPIRSEIWACLAPASPQLAATLAFNDAVLDHAGGEGVYGEMFWAAVESAAFVISDPHKLIRIGLSMIPIHCQISMVIRDVLVMKKLGVSMALARENVAARYSNPTTVPRFAGYMHPCYAVPNHGFTIIGWLYGNDFGDRLLKAVNCGYDTDCTGATLGSVLGIIEGAKKIPAAWRKPVGENIILHKFTGNCGAPKNIRELTLRVESAAKKFADESSCALIAERRFTPPDAESMLSRNEKALGILSEYDMHSGIEYDRGMEITFHYNGEPVLYDGVEKNVRVSARKDGRVIRDASVELKGGAGLRITAEDGQSFNIYSRKSPSKSFIRVNVRSGSRTYSAKFVLFGQDVKRWETGEGIPRCEKCGGYTGSCACRKK